MTNDPIAVLLKFAFLALLFERVKNRRANQAPAIVRVHVRSCGRIAGREQRVRLRSPDPVVRALPSGTLLAGWSRWKREVDQCGAQI